MIEKVLKFRTEGLTMEKDVNKEIVGKVETWFLEFSTLDYATWENICRKAKK